RSACQPTVGVGSKWPRARGRPCSKGRAIESNANRHGSESACGILDAEPLQNSYRRTDITQIFRTFPATHSQSQLHLGERTSHYSRGQAAHQKRRSASAWRPAAVVTASSNWGKTDAGYAYELATRARPAFGNGRNGTSSSRSGKHHQEHGPAVGQHSF